MGVGSARTGESILTPNQQTSYDTWEFLYDPKIELLYAKSNILGGGGLASQSATGFGGVTLRQTGNQVDTEVPECRHESPTEACADYRDRHNHSDRRRAATNTPQPPVTGWLYFCCPSFFSVASGESFGGVFHCGEVRIARWALEVVALVVLGGGFEVGLRRRGCGTQWRVGLRCLGHGRSLLADEILDATDGRGVCQGMRW